ncbi:MAG: hypothetical protein A3J65_04365 [Candidatus Buchananbacteria bacterium RIFCSPHIGHO2_02_FULL_45_11b]|uniref:Peptidase S8/S53 domain-containing protein n=1 Tax=Candidatus Buchananbacteria bacterium RIFCSPHIGHO2_02_FULL_45_11b TaxID=1797541 RepID=A0A1G1YEJ7_9BACT|nr:MAG: hypothetical protein A3J65_04365 [Candidatus Buchananbacteria bacterium RIFCSPHIGHO2_02_FULL_45_11b]
MAKLKSRTLLIAFVPVFLFLGVFCYFGSGAAAKPDNFVKGEVIVKFKNNPEIYKIKASQDVDIHSLIKQYQAEDEIEYLEPNYTYRFAAFPNDPDFSRQWYLFSVKAKGFWSKDLLTRESELIVKKSVIAVLDTGVQLDHPDLKEKIWFNADEKANDGIDNDKNNYVDDVNGWNFVENNSNPSPLFSGNYKAEAVNHGTIVASIAAAVNNNNSGIAGMSWSGQIMPLKVLDNAGQGDVYAVVLAINYAVDNGADVINMSFVGNGYSQSLYNAVKRAYDRNILVVAAAGSTEADSNGVDLDAAKAYPVCYDGASGENLVIGVGSVGKDLKKSSFSNYGGCLDLVAPGESFFAAQFYKPGVAGFEKYYNGYWAGTSLSAPLVSGVLATIKALRPNFNAGTIADFLLKSAKNINDVNPNYSGKLGAGLLDAEETLNQLLGQRLPESKGGQNNYIVAGLGFRSFPQLKILKTDGTVFKAFYPYDVNFNGAINVAVGDVNGDGQEEVITGAGVGGGAHVRIFNINGQLISQFFAYDKKLRHGVNVAAGDVNGDGLDEIITAPAKGTKSEIKVFGYQGNIISQFFAYEAEFFGGVKAAACDINNDGKKEIIAGPGAGGGPQVKIFSLSGRLISQFFAYNANSKGGINLACGDVHGDNQPEIIVSLENNFMPIVRIFTYQGSVVGSFFAYEPNFTKGVQVSSGDVDNDGAAEIIAGPVSGGGSRINIFDLAGKLKFSLNAHNENYSGGVRPAIISY